MSFKKERIGRKHRRDQNNMESKKRNGDQQEVYKKMSKKV